MWSVSLTVSQAVGQSGSQAVSWAASYWFIVVGVVRQYQHTVDLDGNHRKGIVNDQARKEGEIPVGLSDVVGGGN